MSSWEKPRNQRRRKTPSFSSSLLEAIYHSIDESRGEPQEEENKFVAYRRRNNNGGVGAEEEITSLRRAIMLEKWMENYARNHSNNNTRSFGNFHSNSDSSSSTDSSFFSSSETESAASRPTPKSSTIFMPKKHTTSEAATFCETTQKGEGRFMRTKSRALKIYGDLKKAKQPISPGGKIANFLNSIFNSSSSRSNNMKKHEQGIGDWRKSRSVKDSTMRSCLNKTPNNNNKSKRSVRFCPVSVILNEDCQPCGHKNTYENSYGDSEVKNCLEKLCNNRGIYDENCSSDDDDRSCTSSDLFELENVNGSFNFSGGVETGDDELPVYGTTNLKVNQTIAGVNPSRASRTVVW